MATYSYNPKDFTLLVGGVPVQGGFGPGTYITVTPTAQDFTTTVGVFGDVVVNRSHDRTGTIEVVMLQSATENAIFNALRQAGLATSQAFAPVGLVHVADNAMAVTAKNSWVQTAPTISVADAEPTITWTLSCDILTVIITGLPTAGILTF